MNNKENLNKKDKITCILIGAGGRGMNVYADYALSHLDEIEFVAVAEPNEKRRKLFQELHNIGDEYAFDSWEKLLEKNRICDAVFICTQDRMHYEPTIKAIQKGYHIILEKPMSPFLDECIHIGEMAKKSDKMLAICHVLRYTQFFMEIKTLLETREIGDLVSLQLNEDVAFWHYAHSYVRGPWRNSETSGPMILTKSCHDMDILMWLADSEADTISSVGANLHFNSSNAPRNAPEYCLDGCEHSEICLYYAPKTYLENREKYNYWQDLIDPDEEMRKEKLKTSQYGKCVYHSDNNVVDHQTVQILFKNGVMALFQMSAFTKDCTRTIKINGTKGEICGDIQENLISINYFGEKQSRQIELSASRNFHSGGDEGLMEDVIKTLQNGESKSKSSGEHSLHSHLMAFCAEVARVSGKTLKMDDFIRNAGGKNEK